LFTHYKYRSRDLPYAGKLHKSYLECLSFTECRGLLAHAPPCLPLPLPMLEKKGGALLLMGKKRGVQQLPHG
jgi:hypothetical protein